MSTNSNPHAILLDRGTDPLENRNLADAQPETVERLRQILATYPDPVPPGGRKQMRVKPPAASPPPPADDPPAITNQPPRIIANNRFPAPR